MNKIVAFTSLFLISLICNGQIYFNTLPKEKQLIGRDLSTNQGVIVISGEVNNGPFYDLEYYNWRSGEPNNSPPPEDVAEMYGNNTILQGQWNDGSTNNTNPSYVEYDLEATSLGDFIYLGQYDGHSYFKNSDDISWQEAKLAAENLGGYLSSHLSLIHISEPTRLV